ncbi:MAG: hypothetical protein ACN6O3_03965 [Comamonas sp.]
MKSISIRRSPSVLRRWLLAGLASSFVALSACGGGGSDVDRGPTTLPVAAKLNGLYWDKSEAKLYLTDDTANSIRVWDGGKSFPTYAALPPAPASGATLGQLTRSSDGTFYVTRFGFGTDGAVVAVPKGGNAVNLAGTDPQRRRIGITTAPDGALLDGWFIKGGTGAVSQLALNGTQASERELVTGLGKPVGLAVVGDTLYVSDQNSGNVLSYALSKVRAQPAGLADGKVVATFTTLDGIDLMTAASDGTLFFGGSGGKLFQVSPKGETSVLVSGWPKIIGVAYDELHRRVFAAVAADAGGVASVRIVPVK